jgi:protein-disulfide isomerase
VGVWRFVFLAYGIVGCALVLYTIGLWRRLRKAEEELSSLSRKASERESSRGVTTGLLLLMMFAARAVAAQANERENIFSYMLRDGPVLGQAAAPITMIELSDFQCSFCRKFWGETLPILDKNYIKTGKVKFIYHHFAVLGRFSTGAAQASECAAEQGAFWPYHDKLFTKGGSPFAFTQERLKAYARDLGLKPRDFNACIDSGKYGRKVDAETGMAAHLGARGTPAFFVNGAFLAGAQPLQVFEKALQEALPAAKTPPGRR